MTSTWQRVTDLFGAARPLDPTAREAFLAAACADDPGVRQQVEALLSADAIDDGFLMQPPTTAIAEVLRDAVDPVPDGIVLNDRYVVEERFASGGQALVYRAHAESWEGMADTYEPAVARMYLSKFESLWNACETEPEVRQLQI